MPDDRYGSDAGYREPDRHLSGGQNGSRPRGMHTRSVPFDEIEEPVDLVAVQADDELINALASGMSVSSPGMGGYDLDDRVAAILAAWKADIDAEPIPELVDIDTAVSTVRAARPPSRRARHLMPLAAAAAFIVLVIGGLSVGSYNAQPNDMLWGVSKVLYSERAESVEAAARVEEHITKAKEALVAGEPVKAAQELAQAEAALDAVRPEEGHAELADTQDFLAAKAAETPQGQSTNPGAPLATEPQRPVPPGAASGSDPAPSSGSGSSSPSGSSSTGTPTPDQSQQSQSEQPSSSPSQSPEQDVRRAPAGPEQQQGSGSEPTTAPSSPDGTGGGGKPDPTTEGGRTTTAPPESRPESTTTKAPEPSNDGNGAEGGGRTTAAGSDEAQPSN